MLNRDHSPVHRSFLIKPLHYGQNSSVAYRGGGGLQCLTRGGGGCLVQDSHEIHVCILEFHCGYYKIENDLVVEVNLAAPYFVPGKKLYERVRWCLKDKLQLTFKFLMSWTKEGWHLVH